MGQEVEQQQQSNAVEKANKVQQNTDKLKKAARQAQKLSLIHI